MKAKEKAQEMWREFNGIIQHSDLQQITIKSYNDSEKWIAGKKCALISVEELLNQSWDYRTLDNSVSYNSWLEVKTELEKL